LHFDKKRDWKFQIILCYFADIQILPNCTLKTALSGATSCLNPLLEGYPYSGQSICE